MCFQLGIHDKPVAVANVCGFYDPLRQQIENTVKFGFSKANSFEFIRFGENSAEILDVLATCELPVSSFHGKW